MDELEEYFKTAKLPETWEPTPYIKVVDVRKMVETHIKFLRNNPGNRWFLPYYQRLVALKSKIEKS